MSWRQKFPQANNGSIYLDSAATTLKSERMISSLSDYYGNYVSNIHRGVNQLSSDMTHLYETGRENIANFFGVKDKEFIFTSGTTEGLNLISRFVAQKITKKDNIVLSLAEHHSNILPWQKLSKESGAALRFVAINQDGELDLRDLAEKVDENTKVVSLFHMSNVLGTINPINQISSLIRQQSSAYFVVDAAQSVAHSRFNISDLNCDFLVFSAHKMYGPLGLGGLYIKQAILNDFEPVRLGGGMVTDVNLSNATFYEAPHRYEAGTPNMAAVYTFNTILGELEEYLSDLPREEVFVSSLRAKLSNIDGIKFLPGKSQGLVSFNVDGVHPDDIGQLLGEQNIFVRTGSHCCIPLMEHLGINGCVRVSFGVYNDENDIELFMQGLKKSLKILRG